MTLYYSPTLVAIMLSLSAIGKVVSEQSKTPNVHFQSDPTPYFSLRTFEYNGTDRYRISMSTGSCVVLEVIDVTKGSFNLEFFRRSTVCDALYNEGTIPPGQPHSDVVRLLYTDFNLYLADYSVQKNYDDLATQIYNFFCRADSLTESKPIFGQHSFVSGETTKKELVNLGDVSGEFVIPAHLSPERFQKGLHYVPQNTEGMIELSIEERRRLLIDLGNYMVAFINLASPMERADLECLLDNERIPTHREADAVVGIKSPTF